MVSFFSYGDIPAIFHSYSLGKPFETCTVCNSSLLKEGTSYLIEKAFKKHQATGATDVIFEYAICMDCAGDIYRTLSTPSLESITAYFESHVNFIQRRDAFMHNPNTTPEDWLAHCIIKKTPREALDEYQICAHCEGSQLIYSFMPYTLSGAAAGELGALLSAKTLDQMDRFSDQFLGFPPEWRDLLKDRPLLLI